MQIPVYATKRERDNWCDVTVWDSKTLLDVAAEEGLKVLELHAHDHAFSYEAVGDKHLLPQVLRVS